MYSSPSPSLPNRMKTITATTSSKSSSSSFTTSEQELIDMLKVGDRLCKVPRSKFDKPKFRKFFVHADETCLCWESKLKAFDKAKNVDQVVIGQQTALFHKPKYRKSLEQYAHQSFSLICKDRTVDLICEDPMQTFTWIKGLELLVKVHHAGSDHRQSNGDLDDHTPLSMKLAQTAPPTATRHSFGSIPSNTSTVGKLTSNIIADMNRIRSKSTESTEEKSGAGNSRKFSVFATKSDNNSDQMLARTASGSMLKGVRPHDRSPSLPEKTRLDELVEQDLIESKQTRLKKIELIESSEDKQLFEFVVVVKLQENQKRKNTMEPFISYSFPPTNVQKKENVNLMLSIPSFCFPDMDVVQPVETLESETYSFVLTDIDGSRRHGYCRRMLPKGTGKRWPETYCIISSHPCFGLFSELLNHVEQRNTISSVAVFSFLKTVLANPFPRAGTTVSIKAQDAKTGVLQDINLSRPGASDPMLEYIDFGALFNKLSASHVLSLFVSLLLERRLIFLCKDISILSSVTHACMAMIYPFTWQHVFIPVLPKSLLEYVCSPVPFIVGVLSIHKDIVDDMPMEEVVFIDLDNDRIEGADDIKTLPTKSLATMSKRLDLVKKNSQTGKTDNKEIADTFLEFFLAHFGDYRKYMERARSGSSGGGNQASEFEFNVSKFVKSKSKKDKKFFEVFHQSQMFERWSYELELLEQKIRSGVDVSAELGNFEQKCLTTMK